MFASKIVSVAVVIFVAVSFNIVDTKFEVEE